MEKQNLINYLIIGGGVAGTTAAEVIRKQDASGSIVIISDEPYPFYSRIMLSKPNFFLEKIPFDSVWLKKEAWYHENKITLLSGKTAKALNTEEKTVTLDDGQVLAYGKLLLTLGSTPNKWTVTGADKKGVLYLRTLDDAKKIIASVKTAKSAVLIGSGFTSFEMCEMLIMAKMQVNLVMMEPYYWYPLLDEPSGRMIEQALEKHGVKIYRKAEVKEILGKDAVEAVVLKDGTKIPCEMIIPGIGVSCPKDWVKAAGVAVKRGILANEYLETNVANVWTAGDCAEFSDVMLHEQILLGNWVNAQNQGRVAGNNMTAQKQPFRLVSFYTAQGFGITIGFVGDVRMLPDRKVITRGSAQENSYGRVLLRDGHVIGATLINRTQELAAISKMIEIDVDVSPYAKELGDSKLDLKTLITKLSVTLPAKEERKDGKIRIGWFSFSCCEDNTIVMTEVMNDHWQEWKKMFDFRHARVLKSKNILDELDVAFIEGAIASDEHMKKLQEIRKKSKKLVAVGACAIVGMPAGQRNLFGPDQQHRIGFLINRFHALPRVLKVSEVVTVDESIPGCPMDPKAFLETLNKLVRQLSTDK